MPAGPRVLLTVDESPASLAAVRGLHAAGYRAYVATTREGTYAARSRAAAGVVALPDCAASPERYARALAGAAAGLEVAAVLPGTESTLRAITGRESLFGPGVALGTCPPEALEAATSKVAFQELAGAAGLETIDTVELAAADLDDRGAGLSFPAVAKPLRSVETEPDGTLVTVEVERVADAGELRRLLERAPERRWIVQPEIQGTLAAIGGVAWRGELVCATHQVSPRIWPPDRGVTSYGVTVGPDAARERGVARLLASIGWSGVFGLQFILSGDRAYAIDLNPRIYGSIGLAIAAGHNLPAIWADLLLGGAPAVAPYRVGVRYRVEEDDLRALGAAFAAGRRAAALTGLLPRRRTAHAVFAWRDPRPVAVSLAKARTRWAGSGR